MNVKIISAILAVGALSVAAPAFAAPRGDLAKAARAKAPTFAEDQALIAAIGGSWRPAAEVARDKYRHPLEGLTFWGLHPHAVVVDLQPGGGYWTQILAPYAKATGGRYIAGVTDLSNPAITEAGKRGREGFAKKFSDEAIYGKVELANFGGKSAPFAAPGTVDLVITSRELHNWAAGGQIDKIMGDAFAALKPGGYLAVEDHRADPRPEVDKIKDGYISTATVVAAAKKAGSNILIMLGAIAMVHGKNGLFLQNGGFEYCLALIGLLVPVLLVGPGRHSVGRMLPLPKAANSDRPILILE